MPLIDEAHHDGSPSYLPEPPRQLGDTFGVLLRVPRSEGATQVVVRQVHDAEHFPVKAVVDHEDEHAVWWRAELLAHNPVTRYRFLLDGGRRGYHWVGANGLSTHDVTDVGDFAVSTHQPPPDWVADAVCYQIFPDRFARSGRVTEPMPDWANEAAWDDVTLFRGPDVEAQVYGGDLYGVAEHLDHLASLGVDLLYLTPIFPARSNHRYNATTFDRVDPLLGGDEAFVELIQAAHQRGMRVLADFTANHTGDGHEWFRAAQADPDSPEASFYYFTDHPDGYVGWLNVATLPKLDYSGPLVWDRMVRGRESVVGRWLAPPYSIDGWRIDVAHMTARYRDFDANQEVARAIRATMADLVADGGYLLAEHSHDFRDDLPGDGWHGTMNYSGFTKPLWTWLTGPDNPADNWFGLPLPGWPSLPGTSVLATMRDYLAVPWPQTCASMTMVGSHDSPRIATITGDAGLVEVGAGMMFTYPGVPMIWQGDEFGIEGELGEDGRRPMPWHREDTWQTSTLDAYRRLSALRRGSVALRRGGLRFVFADADRIVWLREHPQERLLVLAARAGGEPVHLPLSVLGVAPGTGLDNVYGGAAAVPAAADRPPGVVLPGDGPTFQVWRLPPP